MTDTLLTPPIVDDASRRQFLGGLAAAGLLAGCSTGAAPAPVARTNRIETVLGPRDIPDDPQRVVAIEGRQDLDHVLALDLPLVGHPVNRTFGDNLVSPFLAEALSRQTSVETQFEFIRGEINFEAIAATRPDLIVSRSIEAEENAAQFAGIAPVLPISFDQPWQEASELIARGVGKLERHDQLLARYAEIVSAIRRDRADVLDTRIVCCQVNTEYGIYADGSAVSFKGDVILDVGGRLAPIMEQNPDDGLTLSPEEFGQVFDGADAAIVVVNTPDDRALLDQNPFWQASDIARTGRFVTADFFTNGGGPLTALGVAGIVDDLYALLQC